MPVLVTVRAARGDRKVALNERHADHPGGVAWVTGDGQLHRVALTREVARRIGDGSLDVEPEGVAATVEDGGAPLDLGESIGGFLPPQGDETPLPDEPRAPWQPFAATPPVETPADDPPAPAPVRRKR